MSTFTKHIKNHHDHVCRTIKHETKKYSLQQVSVLNTSDSSKPIANTLNSDTDTTILLIHTFANYS